MECEYQVEGKKETSTECFMVKQAPLRPGAIEMMSKVCPINVSQRNVIPSERQDLKIRLTTFLN